MLLNALAVSIKRFKTGRCLSALEGVQVLKKLDVSVVIPVFNEEAVIKETVHAVRTALERSEVANSEIIVVNDGSRDRSQAIIRSIEGIVMCEHPVNRGYGASLKTGISKARYDWILIIDADGTYPANAIPKLIEESPNHDMVVGARTGVNVHIPLMRRPAKYILNQVANILTGINIPDLNSGLRLFKKEVAIRFWNLFPEGFSFTTTITVACHVNNLYVKYIPINYYKRKGKSTINPIKDFTSFFFLIFRMILYFAPLKFFIPTSAFLFLLAVIWAVRDMILVNHLNGLVVILLSISVQIFFFGLLADLVNKRLR
jgi:glycosyltransferase involved in cell wall biosynthesis